MLSIILIAVLSLNSTLLEIARYRSFERVYKELEENAAFSVLSQYDRDLYKNFGLLAIQADVDKNDLLEYLKANMNAGIQNKNRVESLMTVLEDETEMSKLFNLAEKEVYQMQIDEFCAWRAPAGMLNNTLNLEEVFGDIVGELKNALPILALFQNLSGFAEKLVDMYIKADEYGESAKQLQNDYKEYKRKVESYNSCISERDSYMGNHSPDEEDYESGLQSINANLSENAAELKEWNEKVEKSLIDDYEKYQAFMKSFEALQSSGIKTVFAASKTEASGIEDETARKNSLEMVENLEKGYKGSEDMGTKLLNSMKQVREDDVLKMRGDLQDQMTELGKKTEELQTADTVDIRGESGFWTAVTMAVNTLIEIGRLVKEIVDAFAMIGDILAIVEIVETGGGTFDKNYNNVISSVYLSSLPGQGNVGGLRPAKNPYGGQDALTVSQKLEETREAAELAGFDVNSLNLDDQQMDNVMLQNALDNMTKTESKFRAALTELNSKLSLFTPLQTLWACYNFVVTLIEYIDSLINVANAFIQAFNDNILMRFLYQKVNAAVYASEMFSNRTTGSSDKRLNDSSFPVTYQGSIFSLPNYMVGYPTEEAEYFDWANGEYILAGNASEIQNQQKAFHLMLLIRMLCNIPAVWNNKGLRDVFTAFAESLILFIVGVIIFIVVWLAEAWLDMIFLIYTDGGVDIIKIKGYLDWESTSSRDDFKIKIMELRAKLKGAAASGVNKDGHALAGIKKELTGANSEPKLEGWEKVGTKYVKGLTKWNYKDHLFMFYILFLTRDTIYARCADLTEMQMNWQWKKDGKAGPFKLENMATYIRVDSTVRYKPLLPIPIIPGLNDNGIDIKLLHYSGY